MLPLILPPQGQPVIDGRLCDVSWYLAFQALWQAAQTGCGIVQTGTRAERIAFDVANLPIRALWVEEDTGLVYRWDTSGASIAWLYLTGIYARTQAQIATLQATLGPDDAGLLLNVTDYGHVLQWSASAWKWGPGEQGSGMQIAFTVAPAGSGWQLCNGSSGVNYLKSTGALGTTTVSNTAGSYFRQ